MVAPERTASAGMIAEPARYGEIYDRGYQHYDGPRLGRRHAFWALVRYSMKRAVGIKKGWTSKIIPILLYVSVALTVVIPLGINAFFPEVNVLEYWDFFGFIFLVEGLFVATIAPEMLCGDRRENVLPLYFSRAITRLDYLLGKLLATALLTLSVSLIPCVIYWLGRQLLETNPLTAFKHNIDDLGRISLIGVLIAFYLGAIALMISSFTGRKSIAVAIIVVGLVVSTSLAYSLAAVIESDRSSYLVLLSPLDTISSLAFGVFDRPRFADDFGEPLALWKVITGIIAIVVGCCGVMVWRYVPNE